MLSCNPLLLMLSVMFQTILDSLTVLDIIIFITYILEGDKTEAGVEPLATQVGRCD